MSSSDPSHRLDGQKLAILLVALLSVVLYAPSLRNDLVWDAEGMIRHDPSIRDWSSLPDFFARSFVLGQSDAPEGVTMGQLRYYRPVVKTWHLLEYSVFGENPLGYKATNLLLNAVVTVLALLFLLESTRSPRIALLAALLYAVNPTRSEAVCWVHSDSNILMALFSLSALVLYARGRYLVFLLCCGLALLSRETAVLLPVVVALYELLVRGSRELRAYRWALASLGLAAGFVVLRSVVTGSPGLSDLPLGSLASAVAVIITRFAKILVIPDAPVTVYFYQPEELSTSTATIAISLAFVVALVVLGAYLLVKRRPQAFWVLWFLIWPAVTYNVGQLGDYLLAEKTLYLASLGPAMLIASLAAGLTRPRIAAALVGIMVVCHGAVSFSRTFYWKDTITYLNAVLEFAPEFKVGRFALATAYADRKDHQRAIAEYRRVLALDPQLVFIHGVLAESHFALGNQHAAAGRPDEALAEFRRTLEEQPAHAGALNNIGAIHFTRGELLQAQQAWSQVIQIAPNDLRPYYNIALALEAQGDLEGALRYYRDYASRLSSPPPAELQQKIRAISGQIGRPD